MLPKLPKYPDGEFLGTLLCKEQRGTTKTYRDNYDRIFGKKPLPHGREMTDAERDEKFKQNIEEGFNALIEETREKEVKFNREIIPPGTAVEIERWLNEKAEQVAGDRTPKTREVKVYHPVERTILEPEILNLVCECDNCGIDPRDCTMKERIEMEKEET